MKVRLLVLKPVPRFVGMKGEYGPYEPGDTPILEDEPFADVLVDRGLATRIPLPPEERPSSPSRPKQSSVTQTSLSRWFNG